MAQEQNTKTPPLVEFKVTNPVEYIKLWWKKIIGNEGVDFRLHFHPLTALLIALVIAGAFFGLGVKFEETPKPTPSNNPTSAPSEWKETAFTGTLQYSETRSKYFLTTTSASEAISLQVPNNINLADLVGKRILVVGNYNKSDRLFIVTDTKNLEILPKSPVPVPTASPTPSPTPEPTSSPSGSPTPSPQ